MTNGKIWRFDPPNSEDTEPFSINDSGEIAGYFTDAAGATHGFLRATQ